MTMSPLLAAIAVSLLSISCPTNAQGGNETSPIPTDIQGIRLVNGTYGSHMGRLEVKYNGTWGTVCDDFWSFNDARIACRMLGYADAVCSVSRARFGRAADNVPILMNNLLCRGTEAALDHCDFDGWQRNTCTHSEDAGVICKDESLLGTPTDVRLVESTTTTLTVRWTMVSGFPQRATNTRFRISYESEGDLFARTSFYTPDQVENVTEFTHTITRLDRDAEYTVAVRAEFRYPLSPFLCGSFTTGNYSEPVVIRTNSTLKPSNISVRLVPPESGLPFMGRVEVFHNNVWGTVCDDSFSTSEADVVCRMLNYTEGSLCTVRGAGFGQGQGQIWLDNVDCSLGDEVLEDCTFRPWGVHNCNHGDDVGVICRSESAFPPVQNFTISHVSASSITLRWKPYEFPSGVSNPRFVLRYTDILIFGYTFVRSVFVPATESEYTLTRLRFDREYNISITPTVRFSQCRFNTFFGQQSEEVSAITQESAPTGPPTSFHVVVINSTAVEVLYDLPLFDLTNGIVRGYKIFVDPADGSSDEMVYNIVGNTTLSYIVGGLKPATAYIFSILAYTVADGPRSIHLTAITNPLGFELVIVRFGINGNGLDKETRFTYQRDVHVHCTPSHPDNATVDWYFSNGTKVGTSDRNIREGHYANGTAVLQIASDRRLSYCDAGVYTCLANVSGKTEERNFTLVINVSPPAPSRPTALTVRQDSITIAWDEPDCDGGHVIGSFSVEYRDSSSFSFFARTTIRNIDPNLRKYTINGLTPETSYSIRVRPVNVDGRSGQFSAAAEIETLPPAPSAPRDVSVRIVRPLLVEVRWKVPSFTNGNIIHYTVYAIPLVSAETTRAKRQTDTPKTITNVFPGTVLAGNVSLQDHSLSYRFRVSASIMSRQDINEGDLSSITANSTVFIPEPGFPVPLNLTSTMSTNSSISLRWSYPPPPVETITGFLITYSAQIDWRSSHGSLVRFVDSGEATSSGSSVKVSQLIPGTSYLFKVSALTERGRGAEISLVRQTDRPQSIQERLAFFQVRIGPISTCTGFMDITGNATKKLFDVRNGLSEELVHICPTCGLTAANIKDDELSCRGGLTKQIVYRGRIVGTEVYSATGLVSLIQSWVGTGKASITVQSSRLHLDPTCPSTLDTLRSPDCPIITPPTPATTTRGKPLPKTTEEDKPEPVSKPDDQGRAEVNTAARGGEIGGIFIGSLIVILLGVLTVLLVVVIMKKWKPKVVLRNGNGHNRLVENDKTPFADIGSHSDGDLDSKDNVEKPSTLL